MQQTTTVRGLTRASIDQKVNRLNREGWELVGPVSQEFGMAGLFNRRYTATLKCYNGEPFQDHLSTSEKDWLTVLVLAIILGAVGGHRLYVRKIGTGLLQAFTVWALSGLGLVWVAIDILLILTGRFYDSMGQPVKRKPDEQPTP